MSEELENEAGDVFASATPVDQKDLVDDPKTSASETTAASHENGKETPAKPKARPSTGRPTWHLSLTLGLVIAFAGGVLLWLQSPMLALLVGGGLVILVGLALALWHLFGSGVTGNRGASRRGGPRPAGASGTNTRGVTGTRGANADRGVSGTQRHRGANPRGTESGTSPRGTRRGATEDGTKTRRRGTDGTEPRGRQPRGTDRGGTGTEPRGTRDRPRHPRGTPPTGDRPTQPRGNRDRQPLVNNNPPNRNRDRDRGRSQPPGFWVPRSCVNGGRPPITKMPKTEDAKADEGKTRVKLKPMSWRSRRGKLPVEKPPKPSKPPKPVRAVKVTRPSRRTIEEKVEWPNVDQDHYTPVTAGKLPRITVPRRAVKLGPIYHRKGEPSWPTDDQDNRGPGPIIPPQRDRRGTVSTPDIMTQAATERHFTDAAAVATSAAQTKDEQANTFLQLAGELDGVEGMESVREGHYQAAAAAARDAEVRRGKAAIYGFLSGNPQ